MSHLYAKIIMKKKQTHELTPKYAHFCIRLGKYQLLLLAKENIDFFFKNNSFLLTLFALSFMALLAETDFSATALIIYLCTCVF